MFCLNCGKEIPDHARFCPKCGAFVSGTEPAVPDCAVQADPSEPAWQDAQTWEDAPAATAIEVKPEKKGKGKLILILILISFAVLVVLISFLSASPGGDVSQPPDVQLLEIISRSLKNYQTAIHAIYDLSLYKDMDMVSTDDGADAELLDVDKAAFFEYLGDIKQEVQILQGFIADLEELQKEANAISGLDGKMESARDEYFVTLHGGMLAYLAADEFYVDYLDFSSEIIEGRPLPVDYDTLEEYSSELSAWTQKAKDEYASISCPESIMSEWSQYGELLEYNDSIIQKLDAAVRYDDALRRWSSSYMTDRFSILDWNLWEKFNHCLNNEQSRTNDQCGVAFGLAAEMYAYAELDEREKEAYEFENIGWGNIYKDYEVVDIIYPSLYSTYDALVVFKTGCVSGYKSIVVEVEIPGFTQKYRELFDLDSAYRAIYIKPPALTGDLDLSSAKGAQINVTVSETDGTLIDSKTFPVTIKSKYDFEWYSADFGTSTQDDILCFLTPEASAVTQLKRQAIDTISDMTEGTLESFVGYQQAVPDWDHYTITYVQAAGLMNALYQMGVRYVMDPFSISGSNQRILLPEDVMENKGGLCIETSLVIASALQSAGMHVFLLFPPGHAQVALEVWNNGEGKGEYFLIETTALEGNKNNREHFVENINKLLEQQAPTGVITYYNSDEWADYLENKVDYVIDCDDAQVLGLTQFTN